MRPASIVNFERLYWVAIVLGLVTIYLSWDAIMAAMQVQPGIQVGPGFVIMMTVVGLAVQLLLWYFISRRPSVVAKWIFVGLFAFNVLGVIFNAMTGAALSDITMVLTVLALMLRGLAAWMLFRPDARIWLGEEVPETDAP